MTYNLDSDIDLPPYLDKKKREEDKAKKDANDRDISEYFMKGRTAPQPKPKVYRTINDRSIVAPERREV